MPSRGLALLYALLLPACATLGGGHYSIEEGVRYAGPNDPGDPRVGDVYRPDGYGPRPAVLVIHGGSWRSGKRSEMAKFARGFANAGYVVYNVDYRLAPEHRFPAQLDDVRAAFAWLHDHAHELAADPDRIAVMGYSAGAHLALLLGLAGVGDAPRPRAVVAGGAPSDLTEYPDSPVLEELIGGPGARFATAYADASPIYHVSPDDPPVLLFHGRLDTTVRVEQSERLRDKLRDAGVTVELYEEPYAGHATAYLLEGEALRTALAFLADQMPAGPRYGSGAR